MNAGEEKTLAAALDDIERAYLLIDAARTELSHFHSGRGAHEKNLWAQQSANRMLGQAAQFLSAASPFAPRLVAPLEVTIVKDLSIVPDIIASIERWRARGVIDDLDRANVQLVQLLRSHGRSIPGGEDVELPRALSPRWRNAKLVILVVVLALLVHLVLHVWRRR